MTPFDALVKCELHIHVTRTSACDGDNNFILVVVGMVVLAALGLVPGIVPVLYAVAGLILLALPYFVIGLAVTILVNLMKK